MRSPSSLFSPDPWATASHGWSGPFLHSGLKCYFSFRGIHIFSSVFLEHSKNKSCFWGATGLCGSGLGVKKQLSENVKGQRAGTNTAVELNDPSSFLGSSTGTALVHADNNTGSSRASHIFNKFWKSLPELNSGQDVCVSIYYKGTRLAQNVFFCWPPTWLP